MTLWALAFLCFVVSYTLSSWLAKPSSPLYLADIPCARSLHRAPTSRSGGIAIGLSLLSSVGLYSLLSQPLPSMLPVLVAFIFIFIISLLDDMRSIYFGWRLLTHFTAALLVLETGQNLPFLHLPGFAWIWDPWVANTFILLYIIWVTNLFNFMDGMDGSVAGMGVLGLSTLAFLAYQQNAIFLSGVTLLGAAACTGFLFNNFPPAKIFLGDCGACSIGFFVAAITVSLARFQVIPLWISVLIFSPFVMDATITLILRVFRKERFWKGTRNHFYHKRLLRVGHKKAVLVQYAQMVGCSLSAVFIFKQAPFAQWCVIVGWLLFYSFYFFVTLRFEKRVPILHEMKIS